jgi:hypothetical protein
MMYPGLRPGLSSAVPTGLDFEMVVLMQGLFSPYINSANLSSLQALRTCFTCCGKTHDEGHGFSRAELGWS